jgi:hypothetical protein
MNRDPQMALAVGFNRGPSEIVDLFARRIAEGFFVVPAVLR